MATEVVSRVRPYKERYENQSDRVTAALKPLKSFDELYVTLTAGWLGGTGQSDSSNQGYSGRGRAGAYMAFGVETDPACIAEAKRAADRLRVHLG